MNTLIQHEAIAASAGSGKTFQLAHRYLRLLAHGVTPDRIVALTFSRKAANEIFDGIMTYLVRAARSDQAACETAERIGRPGATPAFFRELLRVMTDHLHRAQIGTLDSFTIGVVRAFSMELGIEGELEIVDDRGAAAQALHRDVLGRVFREQATDRDAQREFLEAFRRATYGSEEKNLDRILGELIVACQELYQMLPHSAQWGEATTIWPPGAPSPWLAAAAKTTPGADALARQLDALPKGNACPAAMAKGLADFAAFAADYDEWKGWDEALTKKTVFRRLLELGPTLRAGGVALEFNRKTWPIPPAIGQTLFQLMQRVMGVELRVALTRTQGLFRLLDRYERYYHTHVRRRGRLTFRDAQYLLTGFNPSNGGRTLSREADEATRLYIDYRLDGRLDHWLLDEFQDTSDLQWEALRNLADEILQDDSGRRSFFFVGDAKQAIYEWRGGNPRLADTLLRTYGTRIEPRPLNTSFRSCQTVIDTVNRVCGDWRDVGLPEATVAAWQALWREHQVQRDKVPASGYAGLWEPLCPPDQDKPTDEDRYRLTAHLLREIDPMARGLTAAVLVRSNANGAAVTDAIRRECPGLPVVQEGNAPLLDNPVTAALMALVRVAVHPGDTVARRHVQMSPLNACLDALGWRPPLWSLALLREAETWGMQGFLREWGRRLAQQCPLDAYGRKRLNDLLAATGEFEAGDARDPDAFLDFIEGHPVRETAAEGTVRVMTVHQSKGLGFDVVLLPDLQYGDITRARDLDFCTTRDPATDRPLWTLKLPRRSVAEGDPVLGAHVRRMDAEACLAELCVLYVALTRAKRALYMIASFPGASSKALTPAALLKRQLTGASHPPADAGRRTTWGKVEGLCLFEAGERAWADAIPLRTDHRDRGAITPVPDFGNGPPSGRSVDRGGGAPSPESGERAPPTWPDDWPRRVSRRTRLERVEPSARVALSHRADWYFTPEAREVLEFGGAIHALLARVEWIEDADAEAIIAAWQPTATAVERVRRDAADQFRRALAAPEVRRALAKPRGTAAAEVWREKPFEIVLGRQWITGAFDRVVLVRDASGAPVEAVITDYKSNRIERESALREAAREYAPQLDLYRRALARLARLAPDRIRLRLLFTRAARVLDCDAPLCGRNANG